MNKMSLQCTTTKLLVEVMRFSKAFFQTEQKMWYASQFALQETPNSLQYINANWQQFVCMHILVL